VIAAGTMVLTLFSGSTSEKLTATMRGLIANSHATSVDGPALPRLFEKIGLDLVAAIALPILVLMLAVVLGNMVQHKMVWSTKVMAPKLSKISPAAGLKRMFSDVALANFAKGVAKLLVAGTVLTVMMWPERGRLEGMVRIDVGALLPITLTMALKLLGAVVAMLAVVAAADYLFQYRRMYERQNMYERQKMSLRDLKDQFKQSEGDPTVRGKMKQVRQSRQRLRMMAQVPKAAVVITNPTHYAIALQYERGMDAPVCVAKGTDALALRIRDVAAEHSVPLVENQPVARALHATVEID
jgi:flagellar biosynthetic protein FlhB